MHPKENKTADKKAYQAEYRKTHPKNKEEQASYMKKYIADSVDIECPICKAAGLSGKYKSYNKYKHEQSIKHQEAEKILKAKAELKKREEEEAELQKKALEEADKKRNKTIKIVKKKSKMVEEKPKEEAKKEEKKEEKKPEKKEEKKPKALVDYDSSSDEEKEEEKLENTVFYFQSKVINSEEVAKYIQEHHEKSANPARSADTKTPRLNKNASLWRKVSKELDGKKWSDLGENFGKIVTKSYDKPSSQADFVQMLKMVVMHFTKVPAGEEKALNMLARKLKTAHVANQK
jgi:hypothetical protein